MPFERRSLWPQEEEERIPGSTYNPLLGSGSPINYEALGLPMDRRLREEEQFVRDMWGDPADSQYDIQVINREDLGLPPLGLMPPRDTYKSIMDTDFKSKISMPSMTPVRNTLAGATSVDDIYKAIFKAEHRLTRKKPWIKTKVRGGSAWGEVQITDGTMETAMNSSAINLSPEEFQYARRYIGIPSKDKAKWLTGPYEKRMYRTIAKKIMDYYLKLSGGDPRGVMTKWYLGLNAGDVKGDPKSSRDLDDVLKRMSKENRRYMEIFLKELGL
jgi:hypothetical protein